MSQTRLKQSPKIKEQVNEKLSPFLKLGKIELNVKDLEAMMNFYHTTLGLDIIGKTQEGTTLGIDQQPLITLRHTKHLSTVHPTHAGLYHFAIVFASRGDLARMIHRVLTKKPHHFTGSADHLVSEAFYFTDPEGNGIELYFDRDRSEWQWENKQVKMATLYIDPVEYLQKHLMTEEPNKEVNMGHFHLKVGDIEKAKKFYVDILGFDITAKLPGALFVSVGGYHHHLGLNTWESIGSPERNQSLGLEQLQFVLPDKQDLEWLKSRLTANNIHFTEDDSSLLFYDPWKNKILAKVGV